MVQITLTGIQTKPPFPLLPSAVSRAFPCQFWRCSLRSCGRYRRAALHYVVHGWHARYEEELK